MTFHLEGHTGKEQFPTMYTCVIRTIISVLALVEWTRYGRRAEEWRGRVEEEGEGWRDMDTFCLCEENAPLLSDTLCCW